MACTFIATYADGRVLTERDVPRVQELPDGAVEVRFVLTQGAYSLHTGVLLKAGERPLRFRRVVHAVDESLPPQAMEVIGMRREDGRSVLLYWPEGLPPDGTMLTCGELYPDLLEGTLARPANEAVLGEAPQILLVEGVPTAWLREPDKMLFTLW